MPSFAIPNGMTFDTLLSTWPDEPLPNISGFDKLTGQAAPGQIASLNAWIEPQQVCGVIIKHHGPNGLRRVLEGIARASAAHKIPMGLRVASVAEFYGLTVY